MPAAKAKTRFPLDSHSQLKFGKRVLKWYRRGHLLGPFEDDDPIIQDVRETPVFTVARPGGDVRPVSDASRRLDDGGPSVNEHIKEHAPELATVQYLKLQQLLATVILATIVFGEDVLLWAKDLDEGYYNLRIREDQVRLTAFMFCGLWFLPMTLAMGLSSAPFLFTVFMGYVVAAMLFANQSMNYLVVDNSLLDQYRHHFPEESIEPISTTHSRIPLIMYYLDDMFGLQIKRWIFKQFRGAQSVLRALSLNAQRKKDRDPAVYQLILGTGVKCNTFEVRIWKEKGEKYIDFAHWLLSRETVVKRDLFSLTGKTRHLAVHQPVLAAFARGVEVFGINDRNGRQLPWKHHIHWTDNLRTAIHILIAAVQRAMKNAVSFDRILERRSFETSEIAMYTDAAGVHGGIGGFVARDDSICFQVHWNQIELAKHHDILWKEMVAIWVMLRLNVDQCRGRNVAFVCDNKPVVGMLFRYKAPPFRPDLFWIILRIAEICLHEDIWPYYHWLEGEKNITADRLSRFHSQPFEHCANERLRSVDASAAALLRTAAQQTANFDVDVLRCRFKHDGDDDGDVPTNRPGTRECRRN